MYAAYAAKLRFAALCCASLRFAARRLRSYIIAMHICYPKGDPEAAKARRCGFAVRRRARCQNGKRLLPRRGIGEANTCPHVCLPFGALVTRCKATCIALQVRGFDPTNQRPLPQRVA